LPETESRACLAEIDERARELVQRMDEIVWAVNPRNDSLVSLALYSCQYAKQLLQPLGLACRFELQPDLPELVLTSEQRYSFFLAFKETINNVARHSGATELHLSIHAENGSVKFLVKDNGCGFVMGSELAGADGLRNIRERIERMGGQCEITSEQGKGTCVSLCVPLNASAKIEA
jgi:signal transduction histidine kinase